MNDLILPIAETYRFNTGFVLLGLDDLSPEDAVRRWKGGEGSSIAYLTGHLSSSRVGILKTLGLETDNPFKEIFGAGVGSQDGPNYPSISELAESWREIGLRLHAALDGLTEEELLQPPRASFPTADQTVRGQIAFIAWHESYHVGQIGILRTEMGYPSIRQRFLHQRDR